MPLTPGGTRVGVYEVIALIGEGGMGQVYRAHDTKLNRDVALKVLPDSFASDPDRLARFTREAQTLASLNHPNIAHIYGLEGQERREGQDGKSAPFLVMELVEGEDLSQRIARGAIPLDEALAIARQIAEALEAAHEQGIVHRDLKPANIKVRVDGTAKVLDFGLAKAMDSGAGGAGQAGGAGRENVSMSPTITTPAMTHAGMILGTAAYMSPEQARGKAVDKRADIWAFGAVLFEMLTGRRAFTGDDVSITMAAVLMQEPDWSAVPAGTPAGLRRLLTRCLKKDPKARLRDIGEARVQIEELIGGASEGGAEIAKSEGPEPKAQSLKPVFGWRQTLLPAVAGAALAAAAVVLLWASWRSETPADRPLVRLDVDLGEDAALPPTNNMWRSIAISPDGARLVYVSGQPPRLFTRRLDQAKASELPGTQGAGYPFFSPDGQWVGFVGGSRLSKISVEGGAVVPLGEAANFGGASWAEDGSIFVSEAYGKGLLQFPAAGGAPKIVAAWVNDAGLVVPQLLPGGKAILSAACSAGGAASCNIQVLTLADGGRKILARGGQTPHYLPSSNGTGHLVYVRDTTLFAIPFDLATLETRGTAVPVLDDVARHPGTGAGLFDVSRAGTLIYLRSRGDVAAMTTMQWVDSTGKKEPLRAKPGGYQNTRISPDGQRILLTIAEGANQDVWVYDPQRDAITRLTFGGTNVGAVWSPDSKYVVYLKFGEGMFQTRADGASPPQALTGSKITKVPWSFTPDGKRLAYVETGKPQIWTVPLEDQGGQLKAGTPEQFLKSNFVDQAPSFSPDSHWLAYHSNESGKNEVYVRAFPPPSSGQGGKWQISNDGGSDPHWSRTGHELVYRSGDQLLTVSYSAQGDAFVAGKPRVWIAALGGNTWDLAPDSKRVAVLIPDAAVQAPQREHEIVMLLNFADELRRRVPLGK